MRRYRIDPEIAHGRAVKAARARHAPDAYIRALWRRRALLTAEQRQKLLTIAIYPDAPRPDPASARSGTMP